MDSRPALPPIPANDFSIVVIPDPQYLAALCSPEYNAIMNWVLNNMTTVVEGSALNIKAVLGVGDCVNTANTAEARVAADAWGILDSNGIPWLSPPGNHDMVTGSGPGLQQRLLADNFRPGGFFAADTRGGQSYWGRSLSGGGQCAWGGSYDATGGNMYFKLDIGAMKILCMSLEFNPRTDVLNWARGVHDANLDHQVIITTHAYLVDTGGLNLRSTFAAWSPGVAYAAGDHAIVSGITYLSVANNNVGRPPLSSPSWWAMAANYGNYAYGVNPDGYQQGVAPASNCGLEMWGGSRGWRGFTEWSNLLAVVNGHFIYAPHHNNDPSGPNPAWYWNRTQAISTSSRRQNVQQIFVNWQELDNAPGCADRVTDRAHLFILKFLPASNTVRAYAFSANTGKWMGGPSATPSFSPVRLFEASYSPLNSCRDEVWRSWFGLPPRRRSGSSCADRI